MRKTGEPVLHDASVTLEVYLQELQRVRETKEQCLLLERALLTLIDQTRMGASQQGKVAETLPQLALPRMEPTVPTPEPAISAPKSTSPIPKPSASEPKRTVATKNQGRLDPLPQEPAAAPHEAAAESNVQAPKKPVSEICLDLVVAMLERPDSRFVRRDFEARLRQKGVVVLKRTAENNLGPLTRNGIIKPEAKDGSNQSIYQRGANFPVQAKASS